MSPITRRRQSVKARRSFSTGVFINCPFDKSYLPLLRPILFTIIELGFVPRIASDLSESGHPRIDRIVRLIRGSRFALHDLSRIKASKVGELFRLNMPFELGLDVGCRIFGHGRGSKLCLILEARKYRYQAAISDLAGSDIAVHGNKPARVVVSVRNWLSAHTHRSSVGPAMIWSRFNDYMAANYEALTKRGFSKRNIEELSINDLIASMKHWVLNNPLEPAPA